MTQDEKHAIALMRYSTIAPAVSGTKDPDQSLASYFREAAARQYTAPDGTLKSFSPDTIDRWYYLYQKEGFDGLMPKSREDAGRSRVLDDACREFIDHMKKTYPRMPATAIYQKMLGDGLITRSSVSESTVNRYVNHLKAQAHLTTNKDMRRYERPHINEVWCGDTSYGPWMKTPDGKKRIFIIALIDDASRMIVGIDLFFQDNFVNLMSVIKSAVARYGRPKVFNFDNGASYRNRQMQMLAARIGSTINYCQPYTPTSKSKIERWFRTLKDQWLAGLDMRDFHSLEELRESLCAFVSRYNQTPHSSLGKKTPVDRFFSEPEQMVRLSPLQLDRSFLIEIERRVSADNVIVIDQTEYEVDYRFSKQRIRLRYSPDMKEIFIVESNGDLTPIRLLNKHDNAVIKREKTHLCKGEE